MSSVVLCPGETTNKNYNIAKGVCNNRSCKKHLELSLPSPCTKKSPSFWEGDEITSLIGFKKFHRDQTLAQLQQINM